MDGTEDNNEKETLVVNLEEVNKESISGKTEIVTTVKVILRWFVNVSSLALHCNPCRFYFCDLWGGGLE